MPFSVLNTTQGTLWGAHLIQEAYLEDELIVEHRPEVPMRMCAAQGDLAHSHISLDPIRDLLHRSPRLSVRQPHEILAPNKMRKYLENDASELSA